MQVLVIDYGTSNLGSIKRSLEECGVDVLVSSDPKDLKTAERIVLPGVGSFADGIKNLHKKGLFSAIKSEVNNNKIPLLGICLGMQLLADKGYEGGEIEGLGFVSGEVVKLKSASPNERIPHVGWNEVHKRKQNPILDGIEDKSDFYFVHSYQFVSNNPENVLAITPYCGGFTSVIGANNVYGVQFHPEKSIPDGFRVLKNFVNL